MAQLVGPACLCLACSAGDADKLRSSCVCLGNTAQFLSLFAFYTELIDSVLSQEENAAAASSTPEAHLTAALAHRRICLRYVTQGWAQLNVGMAGLDPSMPRTDVRGSKLSRGSSASAPGSSAMAASAAASAKLPLSAALHMDSQNGTMAVPFLEPEQIHRQQQQQQQRDKEISADEQHEIQLKIAVTLKAAQYVSSLQCNLSRSAALLGTTAPVSTPVEIVSSHCSFNRAVCTCSCLWAFCAV